MLKIDKKIETLVFNFYIFISYLDKQMLNKNTEERGKNIAEATNNWEMNIDHFLRFELGLSFRKIKNIKNKANELVNAADKTTYKIDKKLN